MGGVYHFKCFINYYEPADFLGVVLGSWNKRGLEDLRLCTGPFREQLRFLMEDEIEMFWRHVLMYRSGRAT